MKISLFLPAVSLKFMIFLRVTDDNSRWTTQGFTVIKKQKRNFNLNQLIGDESKSGKININKGIKNIKKKFPNWYLYINEFFNIIKNGQELFNFSLNNSNYNNVKGITYIK